MSMGTEEPLRVGVEDLATVLAAGLKTWIEKSSRTSFAWTDPDVLFLGDSGLSKPRAEGLTTVLVVPRIDEVAVLPPGTVGIVTSSLTFERFEKVVDLVGDGHRVIAP